MPKPSIENPTKKLLDDIKELVSGLPQHLQGPAFTVLLQKELSLPRKMNTTCSAFPTAAPLRMSSFGEYFNGFPLKIKQMEKLLVAASFAEIQSTDRTFTVESAHDLLKDIGVMLSSANVFMKQILNKKWVITIGKLGKTTYKYRVSMEGHKVLKMLTGEKEDDK